MPENKNLKNKRLFYTLPKSNFFREGERGRVTHALGLASGFAKNEFEVNLVSGPKINAFRSRLTDTIRIYEINKASTEKNWRKKLLTYQSELLNKNDTLLIRYAISLPFFMVKMAKLAGRKQALSIIEVNSLAIHYIRGLPLILQRMLLKFEAYILSHYDVVYVISKTLKNQLEKVSSKLNVIVVPNAANERERLSSRNGERKRIVYFGTMQHYYDFELLINGFKRLLSEYPEISLEFYGKGTKYEEVKSLAKDHPNIKFHGNYDNEAITSFLYSDSDILVLPCKDIRDSNVRSPIKLFEYMSLGLPLLVSNVGQLSDIISDEQNGFIYQAGDVDSFYRKLKYIIDHPDLADKGANQAYEDFVSHHTWQARVQEMIEKIRNGSPK
jgi:glycosyltransferase involved in cell wall biosynthesis